MLLPRTGERFPNRPDGPHGGHWAQIVAVDTHGEPSWVDAPFCVPTLTVECSCGERWTSDLIETVLV